MLKLQIREKNGNINYGIGWTFRILYLLFAIVILIGAYSYWNDQSTVNGRTPIAIAVILLIAGAYQEKWSFDKRRQLVTYRIGLLFLNRKKVIPFSQIEAFELNHFKKGQKAIDSKIKSRANRLYTTFAITLLTGEKHDIEILRHKKSAGRTEYAATTIANYCGVSLYQDLEISDDDE